MDFYVIHGSRLIGALMSTLLSIHGMPLVRGGLAHGGAVNSTNRRRHSENGRKNVKHLHFVEPENKTTCSCENGNKKQGRSAGLEATSV